MQKWFLERICQIFFHKRTKFERITQLLMLNVVKLMFCGNLHASPCTHSQKKLDKSEISKL